MFSRTVTVSEKMRYETIKWIWKCQITCKTGATTEAACNRNNAMKRGSFQKAVRGRSVNGLYAFAKAAAVSNDYEDDK